jgi:P27 family predicted phage terminase small subunit
LPTPRKTLAEHALAGTKPNYEVDVRLSPLTGGRPRFPKDLSKEARHTFKKLCRLLQERRQLTAADGEVMRLYCLALERHKRATVALALEGEVKIYTRLDNNGMAHQFEKANLWIKIAEASEKFMLSTLTSLGLTMTSRDRVKQVKPAGEEEEIIPGSIDDLVRRGEMGMRVVPIDDVAEALALANEDAKEEK